jgi:hypothetical protein
VRRNQRLTLHYRNWYRSLYVGMRQQERYLERMRRDWARTGAWALSVSDNPHRTFNAEVSLRVTMMRGLDRSWRFLQPEGAK